MKKDELLDRMATGALSRRQFSKALASVGLAMTVVPLTARSSRAQEQLTYFTWAGYDTSEFFPAYMEKHGSAPEMPLFADEQEALTKIRAGFSADVAHPCSGRIGLWRDAGVLQPIDTSRLSNWPDIFDGLRGINGAAAEGKQWFVPVDWGNTSIVYRTDLVDVEEDSWTLLWDERYAGKLSIGEDITDTAIIAGLVAGIPKERLYDMSDEEIARIREVLVKQRPLLRFYWSDNTTMEQALATGEVVASSAWNSSVVALKEQGVPVDYMNPKEGILAWCCGLVMTPTTDQVDKAYDLIDAIIAPEAGEWLITAMGYGHSNRKAFDLVSDDVLAERGLSRDPSKLLAEGIFSKDNKRLGDLQQMFSQVQAGL
ncbi:extracellular solute-binding protein [Rhodospirillaceae bacterium SYSU D60014]|uniref:ABC transporter substrate-binding protein n=1 Tax=Virgifigura deserti TaxID=2268457 RepID=UPI0013C45302